VTGMTRRVDHSNRAARWRTEAHLSTGRVVTTHTEWTQAHWDAHHSARRAALESAHRAADQTMNAYGVPTDRLLQFEEYCLTLRVEETYSTEKLHSEHPLGDNS